MQICDMVLPSEYFSLVGEILMQKNEVIHCDKGYERKGRREHNSRGPSHICGSGEASLGKRSRELGDGG